MKVLVAYDGTLQSKDALRYGMKKVGEEGGQLLVLHVFDRSLFIDYDAIPGVEDMARVESHRYVEDAKRIIAEGGGGIRADVVMEEGDVEEEVIACAKAKGVDLLLCPPRYKSTMKKIVRMMKEEGRGVREKRLIDEACSDRVAVLSM